MDNLMRMKTILIKIVQLCGLELLHVEVKSIKC